MASSIASVNDLIVDLECNVCYGVCVPRIRQCSNGHFFCNKCLMRLVPSYRCPVCRINVPSWVNSKLAETLIRYINPLVSCPNETSGCSASFKVNSMEKHLEVCRVQPFACPLQDECKFKDRDPLCIVEHFRQDHSYFVATAGDSSFTHELNLTWYSDGRTARWILPTKKQHITHIVNCMGHIFYLRFAWSTENLIFSVFSPYDPSELENYYFFIESMVYGRRYASKKTMISSLRCASSSYSVVIPGDAVVQLNIRGKFKFTVHIRCKNDEE